MAEWWRSSVVVSCRISLLSRFCSETTRPLSQDPTSYLIPKLATNKLSNGCGDDDDDGKRGGGGVEGDKKQSREKKKN